jgi:hypothetical protein
MRALSAVTIVLFVIFCFLERLLFTSTNFESKLPWAQFESNIGIFRLGWKLFISLAFMLNKYGTNRSELNLVAFSMGALICYRRLSSALMYNKRLYQAQALYELLVTWLFLCIPIHVLTQNQLTIISLVVLFLSGLFLSILTIYLCDLRDRNLFYRFTDHMHDMMKIVKEPRQAEILINQLVNYTGKSSNQSESIINENFKSK